MKAPYDYVKDLMTREEFDSKVEAKVKEWAGLLDQSAASLIVLDECGRLDVPFTNVKDLQDATEASIRVRVDKINPVRSFTRRSGEPGQVVNIEVSDASGQCLLVLWDDDVRLVEQGYVKVGRMIRALDCYVRKSNFGLEVSCGKFGSIIAEE